MRLGKKKDSKLFKQKLAFTQAPTTPIQGVLYRD